MEKVFNKLIFPSITSMAIALTFPVMAKQKASSKKFEYKCIVSHGNGWYEDKELTRVANKLGKTGWEMITSGFGFGMSAAGGSNGGRDDLGTSDRNESIQSSFSEKEERMTVCFKKELKS